MGPGPCCENFVLRRFLAIRGLASNSNGITHILPGRSQKRNAVSPGQHKTVQKKHNTSSGHPNEKATNDKHKNAPQNATCSSLLWTGDTLDATAPRIGGPSFARIGSGIAAIHRQSRQSR